MSRRGLFVVIALLLPAAAFAQPAADYLNPGTMGPNSLPPEPGEPATIQHGWSAELGMAFQNSIGPGQTDDFSATLPFRVDCSFGSRAQLMVEGAPLEAWVVSLETQRAWELPDWAGLTKSDVRIGVKLGIWNEDRYAPAIALRALTKTTTGKGVEDRRYINAPGYLFDLLISKRFQLTNSFALEGWLNAGFLAWQQGSYGQNDAPAWSATLSALWTSGYALRAEVRGYQGWQRDDKPVVVNVRGELPLAKNVAVISGVYASLRDPVAFDVRVGVRVIGTEAL